MGPSHDEVALDRTRVERGREGIIIANRWPLDWLNFFLADVKDGLGPFLAIFLMSSQHWDAGRIGVVLTIAGVATVLARGPGGALVDAVRWKRTLIAIGSPARALRSDLPRSSEDALTTCRRCTIGSVGWHWRASLSWRPRPRRGAQCR